MDLDRARSVSDGRLDAIWRGTMAMFKERSAGMAAGLIGLVLKGYLSS